MTGAARGVVGRLAQAPLWLRLVAAVVLLLGIALVGTGAAATTALRGYLQERVDRQLVGLVEQPGVRPDNGGRGGPRREGRRRGPDALNAYYVAEYDSSGVLLDELSPPQSPPRLSTADLTRLAGSPRRPVTLSAQDGGGMWRVVVAEDVASGRFRLVAMTTGDVEQTVRQLVAIQVVVGGTVLLLAGAATYLVIRRSLRPLVEVEHTASAIAGGDLSRRVAKQPAGTELGRLSRALNAMLGQIERAFHAQRASETRARESEQRMRRFVADASHELRTPLTSIRGFAELYRLGAVTEPEELARVMQRVEDEASRMGLLVEELLLLARLDQQRPLEVAPVDLLALATDAVSDARAVARDRAVELAADVAAGPAVVQGDEARLRQVLGNLVGNALSHTPPGTPVTVAVGTAAGRVRLVVADEGPGMSAEQAGRVFERFYRADESRTRAGGGSGLGLSIVQALVRAHGGSVRVDTAPGRGARFTVELPAAA